MAESKDTILAPCGLRITDTVMRCAMAVLNEEVAAMTPEEAQGRTNICTAVVSAGSLCMHTAYATPGGAIEVRPG